MHIKESGIIIEVLGQMEDAVHYFAEHIDWRNHDAQQDFELFSWVNIYLGGIRDSLMQLSEEYDGSLMRFICAHCQKTRGITSDGSNGPDPEVICSDCRDKMNAAISITMTKRLKDALTMKKP